MERIVSAATRVCECTSGAIVCLNARWLLQTDVRLSLLTIKPGILTNSQAVEWAQMLRSSEVGSEHLFLIYMCRVNNTCDWGNAIYQRPWCYPSLSFELLCWLMGLYFFGVCLKKLEVANYSLENSFMHAVPIILSWLKYHGTIILWDSEVQRQKSMFLYPVHEIEHHKVSSQCILIA